MLKVAVGHSEDVIIEEAVREVLDQIRASLGDLVPQAGILFSALDCDHSYILKKIRSEFPSIELIGCTTDGEMSSVYGFTEDSISLMVFVSDSVEIRAGLGKGCTVRGKEVGIEVASIAREGLKHCRNEEQFAIVLQDPLNAGILEIEKGIEEILGRNFPLIGAASAAHSKKKNTLQFYNDDVVTDSVVLLLFAGPVVFSCGIQGGHAPMGGKEVITSANKNVIYTIGNRPALKYFEQYAGSEHSLFMNYCFAIFPKDREGFYVRSAPFCDPETGSVTLNGIVEQGDYVQIGSVDKETCIDSCTQSIRMALENYPGSRPSAVLLFSCAGRKMMLGTQVIKETQTVEKYLGGIPFSGFYSYGEIGPLSKGSKSLFHGTTFITLLIGSA